MKKNIGNKSLVDSVKPQAPISQDVVTIFVILGIFVKRLVPDTKREFLLDFIFLCC